MTYQNLATEITSIPQKLLELFTYHQKDIVNKNLYVSTNNILRENSEEYIVTNCILNKKIVEKSFNETLFKYIDDSNSTDKDIYKKAFIDKRLFSKIRSNINYHPSFGTVTLLALALQLSTTDYENLLNSASYSLPQNSYINITLKYCFDNKIYDVNTVNSLIFTVSNKLIKNL